MRNNFNKIPKPQGIDKIMNNNDMKSVLMGNKEIVVYGAGNMGRAVIRLIMENGWNENLVCCAVKDAFWNPKEIMGVPVLELRRMPHFKETACFLVAAREELQTEIFEELVQFGCINIKLIDDSYELKLEQKQKEIQNNMPVIKALKEEIGQLSAKISELPYLVAEQNEVSAINTETFKDFENSNYGKEVAVIATGPTLNYYKPVSEAVHIGMNYAWKRKDIPFDYFFIQDGNRRYDWKDMLETTTEHVESTLFIGRYLQRSIWNGNEFPVQCNKGKNIRRYFVHPSLLDKPHQNICFHPLMDFYSVVFPALHFALYTYPKKIYLVGCDVSDNGHFDTADDSINLSRLNINRMKYGYAKVKEFAEQYYPDTQIISLNPVGLKGLFTDQYTDEFLKDRGKENAV
ncbi:hypothetical protein AALC75_09150 [Lachnospiraceae bacterium 48-42]|jgi:hypothetical protein|nr:hypothetical protein [Dorea sp.]